MAILMPPFHIGLVVADLSAAVCEIGELLGIGWRPPLAGSRFQLLHGEVVPADGLVTYSIEGPPYLELIEQRPGTAWAVTGFHHIGSWVDDVHAESDRLAAAGYPLEAVGTNEQGSEWSGGCYHQTVDGLRVELVDVRTLGQTLVRYLSG